VKKRNPKCRGIGTKATLLPLIPEGGAQRIYSLISPNTGYWEKGKLVRQKRAMGAIKGETQA